jgi:phytol kinase
MGYNVCQYLEKGCGMSYIGAMNILGLLLSFTLVGVVVGLGFLLAKKEHITSEAVRKFIHIGVSNWWFILITFFDSLGSALVGPILFIVANGIAVASGLANILGISDRRRNIGLVYFPISLLFLVMLGYTGTIPLWACGIGAITMGYGDGLAALVGKQYGKKKVFGGKTILGTLVMFSVTLVIAALFSIGYALPGLWSLTWWVYIAIIALAAALLEAYTPFGLDNLSVPLGTALISFFLLGGI